MSNGEYYEDPSYFKVGMMVVYLPGMRDDLVGSINIITGVRRNHIETRRWNIKITGHEQGAFTIPIEKYKLKIMDEI